MELFQAKDHYILQQGERALWCSRRDGGLQLRPGETSWGGGPCLGVLQAVPRCLSLQRLVCVRETRSQW
uniref:Phosphatidylinositide phosphatase SAC2 n=1 Tax=Sus scrofa TaxID=9823 RepID=A0A8D0S227_PIG